MPPSEALRHHDLCFGCGQANLFGLQIELEPAEGGGVTGRFFVKQDHQGPPGYSHGGIIAAALDEAMALAVHAEGVRAVTTRLEVDLRAPAPVGTFVRLEARVEEADGNRLLAAATASAGEGEPAEVASATAVFVEARPATPR
jgi:acyl-coenzyme A thioesterase PaaI-like protein